MATEPNLRYKKQQKNLEEIVFNGKLPPQATDLEEAVLGALMLEKDALSSVIDILNPEVFYRDKKSLKGIDFWISYSFLDTKREFLNYLSLVQPDFAAKHTGSLVFKKFWSKYMFGINGTYTYTSGRPYINYNTFTPSLFMQDKTIDI